MRRIGEHGLHYRLLRYTAPYKSDEGYRHAHKEVSDDNPFKVSFAAIAQNEDVLDKAEEAHNEMEPEERHSVMGELLGFPECCREFFIETFLNEQKVDPMYEVACNSGNAELIDGNRDEVNIVDPEPWCNPLWRYFGYKFVTHIPCSFDCAGSIDIAKHRGEIMNQQGMADEANALFNWLSLPMEWSGNKRQARIANEHLLAGAPTTCYWTNKRVVYDGGHGSESISLPDAPTGN
jgi:hypothetical protein